MRLTKFLLVSLINCRFLTGFGAQQQQGLPSRKGWKLQLAEMWCQNPPQTWSKWTIRY